MRWSIIKSNSSVSVGGSGVQRYTIVMVVYLKVQMFPKFVKSHLFPTKTSASSSGRGGGVMYEDTPMYSLDM